MALKSSRHSPPMDTTWWTSMTTFRTSWTLRSSWRRREALKKRSQLTLVPWSLMMSRTSSLMPRSHLKKEWQRRASMPLWATVRSTIGWWNSGKSMWMRGGWATTSHILAMWGWGLSLCLSGTSHERITEWRSARRLRRSSPTTSWWRQNADCGHPCRTWTTALLRGGYSWKIWGRWKRATTWSSTRMCTWMANGLAMTPPWSNRLMQFLGRPTLWNPWEDTMRRCWIVAGLDFVHHRMIGSMWRSLHDLGALQGRW